MNLNVQDPPQAEQSGVLNRNTGFPEPLSPHRNTTLRHPDADTSANATIESKDVPLSRTQSRIRIPGVHRKSMSSSSAIGKVQSEAMRAESIYNGRQSVDQNNGLKPTAQPAPQINGAIDGRLNGITMENGASHGEEQDHDELHNDVKKKKGLFRKSWHKS